jgi:hypothetical protein
VASRVGRYEDSLADAGRDLKRLARNSPAGSAVPG